MNTLPTSLRIGVLRGGPSPEYDVSLKTGANVLKNLSLTHNPVDIFISKDGKWHMNGIERSPERILKNVDVIFNALHGKFGEDGQVQEVLDCLGVPHTGSGRMESAVSMNKWLTKERAILAGVKTPVAMLVRQTDSLAVRAKEVFNSIPHPLIVKPVSDGSSLGLHKVDSYSELLSALESVLAEHDSAIVEEYIDGRQATCGVIENFRGQKVYTLPSIEITPPGKMLDYASRCSGECREICPGNFSEKEKKEIEKVAKLMHERLGLKHYSCSDFVVSPKRGVYFMETNSLPKLHENSFLPKSLKAVGVEVKEFLQHLLHLAVNRSGIMP
ncbi:MAG: hypothetical protein A2566_00585 [Candidatus Zambryskibacteria bacterium RIFOXYD1_FULL_40_13]|nr:MAG: D-alanine-D-alanine ligase [Parcubacteria group bacterium GW2011_GWC1_39_12]KKR19625.1 MAG: D-alanine-D-alanine ligase [Parcubacteria group bacterium GW2011_GWF1_39_37]KKR52593.1 MAG: D-alanine-D-alanine ligase [Parcubacteria group bacterium GW2011_GWE1_40_20]KKR68859.1 MAG: D-alanine-D-alanine ligase [Parcubacteria group bacterium GW2011_GWF2_40_69]KKR80684.1 MAG: D-alanine-D-alanine ligase [Parcubacteria group bacterium GW2011_GWD1_40_9]KKS36119.1 MAG: D-alanine-D-alanine ligase [Par